MTLPTEGSSLSSGESSLIERLFKGGAHFGFSKSRRHPTTIPYIFGNREGSDIIDLEKAAHSLTQAKEVLHEAGKMGKTVLFVGTKEEIMTVVTEHALHAGMPFVAHRWVGGMLTNFSEIKKRIQRFLDLTAQRESGELERKYTKKELVIIGREHAKLENNFGGIQKMERLPHVVVVVDPRHEAIAVREARDLSLPVIGIMSSDSNVSLVDYPIVVNDTLQSSVSLVLSELVNALKSGGAEYTPAPQARKEEARRFDR